MTESWKHGTAHVNGVRLHYVTQGDGPPLVLLHGFPEFWYSWRHQIPVLAPTDAQVNYMRVISSRLQIEIPSTCLTDRAVATLWLDQHAPQMRQRQGSSSSSRAG